MALMSLKCVLESMPRWVRRKHANWNPDEFKVSHILIHLDFWAVGQQISGILLFCLIAKPGEETKPPAIKNQEMLPVLYVLQAI